MSMERALRYNVSVLKYFKYCHDYDSETLLSIVKFMKFYTDFTKCFFLLFIRAG